MRSAEVNWRRAATAVGVFALFLTGWVVGQLPGADGLWFFPTFVVVSVAFVGAITVWLVPRSRRSG